MIKIKPILSLMLMSALLISTTGVSVSRHYCMGNLVEVELIGDTQACHRTQSDHCNSSESIPSKKDCCEDEEISLPGLKLQNVLLKKWNISAPFHLPAITFSTVIEDNLKTFTPCFYKPKRSLYGKYLLIQVQRFLI